MNSNINNFDSFFQFMQHARFRNYVESIVTDRLNTHLLIDGLLKERYFRNALNDHLNEKVPKKTEKYLKNVVPSMVRGYMMSELPIFLSQNKQIDHILKKHISDLENTLTIKSNDILTRIVSDPTYHEINRRYFDTFKSNCNTAISNFDQTGANEIRLMQEKADQSIKTLTEKLDSMSRLEETLEESNKHIRKLESSLWYTQATVFVGFVSVCGCIGYNIFRN